MFFILSNGNVDCLFECYVYAMANGEGRATTTLSARSVVGCEAYVVFAERVLQLKCICLWMRTQFGLALCVFFFYLINCLVHGSDSAWVSCFVVLMYVVDSNSSLFSFTSMFRNGIKKFFAFILSYTSSSFFLFYCRCCCSFFHFLFFAYQFHFGVWCFAVFAHRSLAFLQRISK